MTNDSRIEVGVGGTSFIGTDAVQLFSVTTLRSGIKLLQKGLKPSRGWTMTNALARATGITGKKYKRSQADAAVADLTVWIETMKAALQVVQR